ncbi:MAG TPA: VOC family protein [Phycisphaerae bacterium]|nr:VOC family protein [Phycisphaerae bacterium]
MGQPVVHFEIGCRDKAQTVAFYSDLFDWKVTDEQHAAMVNTGASAGIQGHITALGHEPHNYINLYVEVDDPQAYLDRAAQLGGKTIIPPTPVPGKGTFAWLADPEGTMIGLWKPA